MQSLTVDAIAAHNLVASLVSMYSSLIRDVAMRDQQRALADASQMQALGVLREKLDEWIDVTNDAAEALIDADPSKLDQMVKELTNLRDMMKGSGK